MTKTKLDESVFGAVLDAMAKYEEVATMPPKAIVFNTKYYEKMSAPDGKVLQLMGMDVEFADLPPLVRFFVGQKRETGDYRMVF